MKVEIQSKKDLAEQIMSFNGKILFGVPESTSNYIDPHATAEERKNRKMNNAMILALMEAGSPLQGIPPRKLLRPVIEQNKDKIEQSFKRVYDFLVAGDETSADNELEKLALRIETWAKAYFRNNDWAPNSPNTARLKNLRAHKPPNTPTMPLIDTGSLRGSIRAIYVKNKQ